MFATASVCIGKEIKSNVAKKENSKSPFNILLQKLKTTIAKIEYKKIFVQCPKCALLGDRDHCIAKSDLGIGRYNSSEAI